MTEQAYLRKHEQLMNEMRRQIRLGNRVRIERTGRRLHRLRVRYRRRFAA